MPHYVHDRRPPPRLRARQMVYSDATSTSNNNAAKRDEIRAPTCDNASDPNFKTRQPYASSDPLKAVCRYRMSEYQSQLSIYPCPRYGKRTSKTAKASSVTRSKTSEHPRYTSFPHSSMSRRSRELRRQPPLTVPPPSNEQALEIVYRARQL